MERDVLHVHLLLRHLVLFFFFCKDYHMSKDVLTPPSCPAEFKMQTNLGFNAKRLFKKITFIGVQLVYNVVLVSSVQQNESVIHIHICTPFQIIFSYKLLNSIY